MSTNMKIFSVAMPPELEEKIYELRATKEFRRCSYAEMLRRLIEEAMERRDRTEERNVSI